jgi:ABC-type hemin transport system ATPase subunit
MSEIIIKAIGLGVEFGSRRAVDGVSLLANGGTVTAIVGPNGSGKTTLLRALAGLIPAASGILEICGADPRRGAPADHARHRIYCPQKPTSSWDYRVEELGEICGEPADFETWLSRLGGRELATRPLSELSGGEQKCAHLAMILATLHEAYGCAVLLDEPTTSLDLVRQQAVRDAARDLARAGAACVVATHDIDFIRSADTVLVLSEGRLIASGPPEQTLTLEISRAIWGA